MYLGEIKLFRRLDAEDFRKLIYVVLLILIESQWIQLVEHVACVKEVRSTSTNCSGKTFLTFVIFALPSVRETIFRKVFNNAISFAEVIYRRMGWKCDHELWLGTELK
jgi:hypothetical protein